MIHEYITKLQIDYTRSQFYQKKTTSTSNLGLPCLKLTNLRCPTSNGINYGLVEHRIIESQTIYRKSLPI